MRRLCFFFLALIVAGLVVDYFAASGAGPVFGAESVLAMGLPWRLAVLIALPVAGILWRRSRG